MMGINSTNLKQTKGGEVVKQGDFSSAFEFELLDYDNKHIESLDGQSAKVKLGGSKGKLVINTTVEGSKVKFNISKILPVGVYQLEIEAGDYVFPSDQSAKIDVIQSVENYQAPEVVELGKVNIQHEISEYLTIHPVDIAENVKQYLETHPIQPYNDSALIQRIEALEARPAGQTVDLSTYLTSDFAYQTFVNYTALRSQMTETIKNKHLELGLDALIDTKLSNGGDPFQTLSKAKETFATKEELTSLISRIVALENKNQ